MRKAELVIVPSPAAGHIVSTLEFAMRLLQQDGRLSITILVARHPFVKSSYTQQVASFNSNIRFIDLPQVDLPPVELLRKSRENFVSVYFESHKSHVKEAIVNHLLSKSIQVVGLIVDMFCTSMFDVANELCVPSYVFFTSAAAFLSLMMYLPIRHSKVGTQFSFSDPDSIIPAFANPVPSSVLPSFLFNKAGGYETFVNHAIRFKETKGVFVNTFIDLESHPIKALNSENGMPQVYAVGPLLREENQKNAVSDSASARVLKWLDDQPRSSVVILSFGSSGGFEPPQLAEIATALEQSEQRFLWSIRRPQANDHNAIPEYTDFSEVLPEGFLERTRNRGMVCGWIAQVEVLAHEAVGGFVSHCGWNSILESVWYGVPIATWPIYAEQQINAFYLMKELELAVELTLDYRILNADKLVKADKIEKALRSLMDPGNPVRMRVKEMSEKSRNALIDGGSSCTSLGRLVEDILVKNV